MKRVIVKNILPWLITLAALYLAFRGVEWDILWGHVRNARVEYLLAAVLLTISSYWMRAARWPLLFPSTSLPLISSWKVLVLGFFMNNILPARAGELIRAHLGAKVLGSARTLVLATIASERLADGLTISLFFALIIGLLGRGNLDPSIADNLMYVAYLFAAVAVGVIVILSFRDRLAGLLNRVSNRLDRKASTYALSRVQMFIDGLSPLTRPSRAWRIALWSGAIWGIELVAFAAVSMAFGGSITLSGTVLFLVAVNFSSLIPAAPGGFGVIELIAKSVLVSAGVASPELALSMVLAQHVIQYAVIGIPGAFLLSNLRSQLADMSEGGSGIVKSAAM
ncbi:MAG: lysylphosphatidylglycerol synthase transmembrane domain-containing protein [Pseudomonadota bacterium]|jgi:uncharacterized protein (TIRG00374 family)